MHIAAFRIVLLTPLVALFGVAHGVEPGALLERYAANVDRAASWRLLCNSVQDIRMDTDPNKADVNYRRSDVRSDGERVFWGWHEWGAQPESENFLPEKKTAYHSFLWDGQTFSNYRDKGNEERGVIVIHEKPHPRELKSLRCLNVVAPLLGTYPNAYVRVDRVLCEARDASVREETESINGAECFVIDAKAKYGDYAIWIDPAHGYNIVRAEVRVDQSEGHLYLDRPMKGKCSFAIEIQRFGEYEGVWVAMEATLEESHEMPRRGSYTAKSHFEVIEFLLDPDHEAMRSFTRDDVRDGTWGWISPYDQIKRIWRQGDFVAEYDADVVAQIDRTVASIRGKSRKAATATVDSHAKSAAPDPNEAPPSRGGDETAHAEGDMARSGSEGDQTSEVKDRKAKYPHCGLYCVYTMVSLAGRQVDFAELVKPEYLGAREGSSLVELYRAALDFGVYAEPVGGLTKRGLERCPYPAILHVRSHAASPKYDHYELFLGVEKGKVRMYSPPETPRLVEFKDLMPRWDGRALFLSDAPVDTAAILTADRQRWLFHGMIGVVVVLVVHVGQRICASMIGQPSRRWSLGLSAGQAATLGLAALLCGGFYHFANDEGLLANAGATEALQMGHAADFIPKLSARTTRKRLGGKTVFIDARFTSDYERGHLSQAISLPIDANDALWEKTMAEIPARTPIVAYCQSARCQFAEKVSLRLKEEGYRDVSVFKGGWVEWVDRYGQPEPPSHPPHKGG